VLSSQPQGEPGVWCVAVAGELDIATEPQLDTELRRVLAAADTLLLDLSATTFIDAAGVGVLVDIRTTARAEGKSFRLVASHPAVRRVLDLVGLAEYLAVNGDEDRQ
jgi:anti-sigma B factor antagonist